MKKFASISLALLISISTVLVGCKEADESSTNNGSQTLSAEPTSFQKTSTVLVENFQSEYKIVIPEATTKYAKYEQYAAEELQYFLEESTGCKLPIVTDSGLTADPSSKYLSIGNTTLLAAQTDIKIDDSMGDTTPSIDTVGNSVYMAGATGTGILNSVYKFLEYEIGWKAYAYDCVDYDFFSKLYLLDFDYHYTPNIEYFNTSEDELAGDARKYGVARLNMTSPSSGGATLFDGTLFSGLWCHTNGVIMGESGYPWAYHNGQICMSDPEVLQIYCENFTMNFALNASGPFLMIGGNDNESVCNCADCTAIIGQYGSGGLMAMFINKVCDYVETYFAEHNIDKKLCIVGLYYLGYDDIPAKSNGDGTYSPIADCVIPDNTGNVTAGLCYAPMLACYTHPFGDDCCEKNSFYTEMYRKAASLTDNLFTYIYGNNFSGAYDQCYFFNNFSTFAANYKFFNELGVRYVTEEANHWGIRQFSSLNIYLRSRFAWDENTDMQSEVTNFISAYYGIAADLMQEYYNAIMEHYQSVYQRRKKYCESVYDGSVSLETYPHQVYLNYASIMESAMHLIEKSDLPEEEKAIYYERVQREWYIVKIQEYQNYKDSVDKDYLAQLEQIFADGQAKYNIWVARK